MSRVNAELFWRTCGDIYRRIFSNEAQRPIEAWWQTASEILSDLLVRIKESKLERSVFLTNWDQYWGMQPLVITEADVFYDTRLVGARQVNQVWFLLVRSPTDLPAGPSVLTWQNGFTQAWAQPVRLMGDLWVIRLLEAPLGQMGRSVYFGVGSNLDVFQFVGSRPMTLVEQGARFFVEGFNISHAAGLQSYSAEARSVEVSWLVDRYEKPLAASRAHLMLALVGTRGAIGVQLRDESGLRLEWINQSVAQPMGVTGSLLKIEQALYASSSANPLRVTMRVVFYEGKGSCLVELEAAGVVARADGVPWDAQTFRVSLNVAHQLGVISGYAEYVDVDAPSETVVLALTSKRRYQVDPPIHACTRLMTEPMRLGAVAEVTSVVFDTVSVELADEDDYAPEYAALVQGANKVLAVKVAQTGELVSYRRLEPAPATSLDVVLIEPMYLEPAEYSFEAPGVLLTDVALELGATWYARASRAMGVGLWERFGLFLGMQRFEDSERSLGWLRGVWLGVHAPPAPRYLEAAIASILGVQIPTLAGRIEDYELEVTPLGAPLNYFALMDTGERLKIPASLELRLYPVGHELAAWEQPVRGVYVFDRIADKTRFDQLIPSAWGAAHKFVVSIPDELGTSAEAFELILEMLQRAKPTWTQGIVELAANSPVESQVEQTADVVFVLERPSPVEDMVFPDWVEVIQDDESVNPDEQTVGAPIMQGRQLGFDGLALGFGVASFLKHTLARIGLVLGSTYPREELIARDVLARPWSAIGLKEPVTAQEIAQELSRDVLRIATEYKRRSVSMVRVLDDVGDLLAYTAGAWISGGVLPEPDLFTTWMSSPWDVLAGGASGTVLRSTNYGASWTDLGTPMLGPVRSLWGQWAVTLAGEIYRRTAPTTYTALVHPYSHSFYAVHEEGGRLAIAGESADVPTRGVVLVSTNGGASFDERTLPDPNSIVFGVRIFGSLVFAATEFGAYISFDLGASWTLTNSGVQFVSVAFCEQSGLVFYGGVNGSYGVRGISSNAPLTISSLSPGYGLGDVIRSIAFHGRQGLIVVETGDIWESDDGGVTWALTNSSPDVLTGGHLSSSSHRAVVGFDRNFRWRG